MISDRPLTTDELEQFERYRDTGFEHLGMSGRASPKLIVQAIDEYVLQWQAKNRGFAAMLRSRPDSVEPARALAVVWGDQIVRHFDWHWTCEVRSSEERYAVCSANRSLIIYPPQFIHDCMHNPKMDCTVMLAFNMQEAGNFTGCEARAYVDVMSGIRRIVPRR